MSTTLAERVRSARSAAKMSLDVLYAEVRARIGRRCPSTETIRRIERGTVTEDKVDPLLVVAIAEALGVTARDLSPVVADELNELADLLTRSTGWLTLDLDNAA